MKRVKVILDVSINEDSVNDSINRGFDQEHVIKIVKLDFLTAKVESHYVDDWTVNNVEVME